MYKKPIYKKSSINRNESLEGQTIEQKIEKILNNKEPIKDGAPIIYSERNEGVISAYNIRTDRWEIATEAMDTIHKNAIAKREGKAKNGVIEMIPESGETTSTGGTSE